MYKRQGLLFALCFTILSILLSVVIAPASQRAVRDHMITLSEEKPGLALREGAATSIGGWRIEAREVEDEGARLAGILLFMPSLGETLFSQRGAVHTDPDGRKRLVLEDGLVLSNGENRASLLPFDQMDTVLPEIEEEEDLPVNPIATLAFGPLLEEAQRTDAPAAARWLSLIHI